MRSGTTFCSAEKPAHRMFSGKPNAVSRRRAVSGPTPGICINRTQLSKSSDVADNADIWHLGSRRNDGCSLQMSRLMESAAYNQAHMTAPDNKGLFWADRNNDEEG